MEGYKTSNYTTVHKTDYGLALFNTYSCGLLKITDEEAKNFDLSGKQIVQLLAKKNLDYMQALVNNGFLVGNDVDEFALVKSGLYRQKYGTASASITINTGLACNCRCVYCYEDLGHSDRSALTPEKTSDIIAFLVGKFTPATKLHITFLGGEPLVCFEQIKRIYSELNDAFDNVSLDLVTNGVLIDEDVANFLKEAQPMNVQVSIDGLKHHHDKKRIDASGGGTYDRIMANVKILQNAGVPISVRTHIDQEFMDNVSIQEWIDAIKKDFDLSKPIWFYVAPVLTVGRGAKTADGKHVKRAVSIYEAFMDNEIPARFSSMLTPASSCFVTNENSFSISCDGEIYKCWLDLTARDFNGRKFGNIYDGVNHAKLISYTNSIDVFDNAECRACVYLPMCLGGCPEYVLSGSNKCTALKQYPEKIIGLFMRHKGYPLEINGTSAGGKK